jgi:hypothetical protein
MISNTDDMQASINRRFNIIAYLSPSMSATVVMRM